MICSASSELVGDFFHGVDGGAVDIGLAGLAQTSVVHRDAETFQQGLEGGRAAVHVGGLDDFRNEEFQGRAGEY